MKYTLTLLITLFCMYSTGQQVKINPTGKSRSACPGITATVGASGLYLDALADTILAGAMAVQGEYQFEIHIAVTSGLSLGNITGRLKLGNDSISVMSGNLAIGQTNKLVIITGKIVAQSPTSQYVVAEIKSDGSLISTLSGTNVQVQGAFSQNLANMLPVKFSLSMAGLLVGSSMTVKYWRTDAY